MKHQLLFIVCLLSAFLCAECIAQKAFQSEALRNPKQYRNEVEGKLEMVETPIYQRISEENHVLLENGYAKYQFRNPDDWPPNQEDPVRATKVRVIFTKYPKDSAFWLTDYQWLLSKRLKTLFELDSNLNRADISYSILLQTDCDNEFEALQLFHGIEITYEPIQMDEPEDNLDLEQETMQGVDISTSVKRIHQFMNRSRYVMDSTVFNIFERNEEWQNAMLVLDWTGSMYGHGAEAMLWHALNAEDSYISHCTFFNDGDRTKNRKKQIGYTNGIYSTSAQPPASSVKLMRKVQHRGNGGDSPENDIEALLAAMKAHPEVSDIILIADNASCIRDFVLLQYLNRPIHIVLCRMKNGINPQYINLARKTGGSIYFEDTVVSAEALRMKSGHLEVAGSTFILGPNNLALPADRSKHFYAHCDRYNTYPRKTKRKKRQKEPDCYFVE